VQWHGPEIRQVPVRCWYAEPSSPSKPIGGVDGIQKVDAFVPIFELQQNFLMDQTFRQTDTSSFSGGGKNLEFKPDAMPRGLFVSVHGHPIYRVTAVKFPSDGPLYGIPLPLGPHGNGVTVSIEFEQAPQQGECYLYVAVWLAGKVELPREQ
jgi:hypothetical protein